MISNLYVPYNAEEEELIPKLAHHDDAGLDLKIKDNITIEAGGKDLIGTGVRFAIPPGHFGFLVPRSSTGKLNIMLANTVGIIDSGYRGEVKLFIRNLSDETIKLKKYTKIAQIIIVPYVRANLTVDSRLDTSTRGEGGFGSTGE